MQFVFGAIILCRFTSFLFLHCRVTILLKQLHVAKRKAPKYAVLTEQLETTDLHLGRIRQYTLSMI